MPSGTDSLGSSTWRPAIRKPVIGVRTWGVMDVIEDGRDGLLVPFGDVPALAAARTGLLADAPRRAEMGAYGAEKVYRMHTWDVKYPLVRDCIPPGCGASLAPCAVLHVVHQYLPEKVGGTELYTQWVSQAFARRGHKVDVFYRSSAAGHLPIAFLKNARTRPESGVGCVRHGVATPNRRFLATFGIAPS